jgi:hypothetical protein
MHRQISLPGRSGAGVGTIGDHTHPKGYGMTKTDKIEMAIAKIHERLAHLEKMALLQAELHLLESRAIERIVPSKPVRFETIIPPWLRRKPK